MTSSSPFQRLKPFRSAKKFVVAVEGAKTELEYFDGLRNRPGMVPRPQAIRLEVLPATRNDSAPPNVVARLASHVAGLQLRPMDACWLVFDIDRHKPAQVHAALRDAHQEHWNVAVSNPCFEIWLTLHFVEAPKARTSDEAKAEHRQHRASASDPHWPYTRASVLTAVERGRNSDDGEYLPAPGHTHVHRLVSDLLEATDQRSGSNFTP